MTEKESWISKQEPKPFDADENGKILAKVCASEGYRTADFTPQWVVPVYTVSIKEYLENDRLVEWRHTDSWLDSHEESPRQVQYISGCGEGGAVAIAKDGTLWKLDPGAREWRQLPDLPKGIRKVSNGIQDS